MPEEGAYHSCTLNGFRDRRDGRVVVVRKPKDMHRREQSCKNGSFPKVYHHIYCPEQYWTHSFYLCTRMEEPKDGTVTNLELSNVKPRYSAAFRPRMVITRFVPGLIMR